jgi:hypothetical protein
MYSPHVNNHTNIFTWPMNEASCTFGTSTDTVAAKFLPENHCSTAALSDRWFAYGFIRTVCRYYTESTERSPMY